MLASLSIAACTFDTRSVRDAAARTGFGGATDVVTAGPQESGAADASIDARAYSEDGEAPDLEEDSGDPSDDAEVRDTESRS